MLFSYRLQNRRSLKRISGLSGLGRLDQLVRYAAHGGDHRDAGLFLRGSRDNLRAARDAGGIAH